MSSDNTEQEPVTFVDKRKIDPETGEIREAGAVPEPLVGTGAAPQPDSVDEDGVEGELLEEAPSAEAVELAERTADLQRLQAEYANYRRRVERDRQSVIDNAKAAVVTDLLAVLDDLDRARSHGDLEASPLKSVADKLVSVMGKQNVVAFGLVGDPFDPSIHEAVQHEGDGHNPVVGSLFRQGYKLGDKVLRTAMVSVVDGSSEQENK